MTATHRALILIGKPVDECMETIDFAQWMALYELRGYMDEHPEVTNRH